MRGPIRYLLGAWLAVAAATTPAQDIDALLKSRQAVDRANGAVAAAKGDASAWTAELLEVLKSPTMEERHRFAEYAVLDALVRSSAKVVGAHDGAKIADLPRPCLHAVAILLTRNVGTHQNALTKLIDHEGLHRDPDNLPAIAVVCDVLAQRKTPGLAKYVVTRLLDQRVHVWLVDGSKKAPLWPDDTFKPAPIEPVPEGFPPIGFIRLVAQKGKKNLVLKGKPNVGWVRVVAKPGERPTFDTKQAPGLTPNSIAIDTLAKLLELKPKKLAKMLAPLRAEIRARNDAQVERQMPKIEARAQKGLDQFWGLIDKQRLLRADQIEKVRAKKVKIDLHDLRRG